MLLDETQAVAVGIFYVHLSVSARPHSFVAALCNQAQTHDTEGHNDARKPG